MGPRWQINFLQGAKFKQVPRAAVLLQLLQFSTSIQNLLEIAFFIPFQWVINTFAPSVFIGLEAEDKEEISRTNGK